MKTITVNEKEYKLEFAFEAAEYKDIVQKMFDVLSGAYVIKRASESNESEALIGGVSEMVSEIPQICSTAFYAGLLENNPLQKDDSKKLMRDYMKENKLGYSDLYEELRKCMEDDGFFDLSGINGMLKEMNLGIQTATKKRAKQTSTK